MHNIIFLYFALVRIKTLIKDWPSQKVNNLVPLKLKLFNKRIYSCLLFIHSYTFLKKTPMKKILFVFLLSSLGLISKAQTTSTDLYDLLKMLVPDSASTTLTCDWKKGNSPAGIIKWESLTPKKNQVEYYKSGAIKLVSPDQKPDDASIYLSGATLSGYAEIQISMEPPPMEDEMQTYKMEKLLGKKPAKIKLIKEDGEGFPMYYYEVKFPGKKPVWFILMMDYGGARGDDSSSYLMVTCLFDKKEFERRSN